MNAESTTLMFGEALEKVYDSVKTRRERLRERGFVDVKS